MITVTLFKKDGRVTRVRSEGHSGLAESGNDVLCAAVSAIVQTAYMALVDLDDGTGYKRSHGKFEFDVPEGKAAHDSDVIIRAMYIGLKDLSSGYPQNLKLEEA